ncbi:MAG TPA: DDE-type integrase/transposase/recombinase [Kofleriaceae bacterium]|nr:DDE-type integrase/transposase/recombinase [Kofleriaceae bacterium]
MNHKRVYRLHRADGLSLRVKRRKRRAASKREQPPVVTRPGERWAMDFVSDCTSDGHRFRILTLIDTFARRAPGVVIERSISGARVVRFLDEVAAKRGYPKTITVDNGREFISNALDQWAHAHGVTLHFSRPGKLVDNAFIESFNGRLREESQHELVLRPGRRARRHRPLARRLQRTTATQLSCRIHAGEYERSKFGHRRWHGERGHVRNEAQETRINRA